MLAFALAPVARAKVTPKIVNGSSASITDFPFQVAVFDSAFGQICGGVIIDSTHVVTAAHCLFDVSSSAEASDPANISVLAGTADLNSGGTFDQADSVAFDPSYDPTTNDFDVGVITLHDALWTGSDPAIDGTNTIAPISFINETDFSADQTAGATAVVTGWGDTNPEPPGPVSPSDTLMQAHVPLVDDATCATDYDGVAPITPRMFCAGNGSPPIQDSCQGDSGGPIVLDSDQGTPNPPNDYVLAGLVDSGQGCAQAGFPGIYDRMSNTDLQSFVTGGPPQAPRHTSLPTVSGGNSPGQTLTCSSGNWTGSPDFTYQFLRSTGTALTNPSATGTTYTIQTSDIGSRILCEVEATNLGGYGFADSGSVLVPIPPGPPPPPPPPAKDTTAPSLRISKKSCTKTSCTLKVKVTDAGTPTSGVAKVKATLSFSHRVSCRRHGRRTTCTKHVRRALKATAGTGGVFTIVAKRLSPGKGYTVTLVPFDNAGNRPQFSTVTNVHTKPRHPHGLF